MSMQAQLFDQEAQPSTPDLILHDCLGVPGLTCCPNLLDREEQEQVLAAVDAQPWLTELKRRVQHYGYKYDYKARSVDPSMFLGPLPEFGLKVAEKLLARGLIEQMPDQMIVNEYKPPQGISAHVDCEPRFGGTIVTVSLGWAYEMEFISVSTGEKQAILLGVGSTLSMRKEARYSWMHRISGRLSDRGVRRKRRVSLTYRYVVLDR